MSFLIDYASAQQIPVTLDGSAHEIIFDGKWSFRQEWKATTLDNEIYDDSHEMVIKTGHDYENLYVLLDFVTKAQNFKDRAYVCVDNSIDRGIKPTVSTFCFTTAPDSQYPITLQGGSPIEPTGFFAKIKNHPNFIAIEGISDQNDRYSRNPHESYEFKIPIDVIGASDRYGFYVSVIDGNTGKSYNWPHLATPDKYPYIPPPNLWGEIFSPDHSLPEFSLPFYILLSALLFSMIVGKMIERKNLQIFNRF